MDKCISQYFLFGDKFKKSEEFENYNRSVGKSLYEVIRIDEGVPVFLEEHLNRLETSAKIIGHNLFITKEKIIDGIFQLIHINNISEGNLKLVVNTSFLAYFIPYAYPSKEQYQLGVKTITYNAERISPNAKVVNNEFKEKVSNQINSNNVYEAILVDHEGFITEGSRSNIFMVMGSKVLTSKVEKVLPGITRQFIIKTCEKLNIVVEEKNVHKKDIESLTGLFISGTSPNVLPISVVDEFSFDSSNNFIIKAIMEGFRNELNEDKQKIVKFIENRSINK